MIIAAVDKKKLAQLAAKKLKFGLCSASKLITANKLIVLSYFMQIE